MRPYHRPSPHLMDPSKPPFTPLDPSGRSNGILASHNILAGTILPGEHYLLRVPWEEAFPMMSTTDGPMRFLSALYYDQLQAFIAIPPVPPSSDPQGTIGSDLIMSRLLKFTPVVVNKGDTVALFLLPRTRVRHSCASNAKLHIHDDGSHVFSLQALAHIPRGSEILISFLVDHEYPLPFARRQDFLRSIFRFECTCQACRRSPEEQVVADAKLSKVHARLFSFEKLENARTCYQKGGPRFIKALLGGLVEIVIIAIEEPLLRPYLRTLPHVAAMFSLYSADIPSGLEWNALLVELARIWGFESAPIPPAKLGDLGEQEILVPPPQQLRDFVHSLTTPPASFLVPAPSPSPSPSPSSSPSPIASPSPLPTLPNVEVVTEAIGSWSLSESHPSEEDEVVKGGDTANASFETSTSTETFFQDVVSITTSASTSPSTNLREETSPTPNESLGQAEPLLVDVVVQPQPQPVPPSTTTTPPLPSTINPSPVFSTSVEPSPKPVPLVPHLEPVFKPSAIYRPPHRR